MGRTLTGVAFDALDIAVMERFWRAAIGGRTSGLQLRFAATDKPKTGKNRLHLDLAGGPGWGDEVERLLGLGAIRIDIGQGDVPWDVLADPEGNEFCVLRPGEPGVFVDRGLAAICLDVAEEDRPAQQEFWQAAVRWAHAEYLGLAVRLRRTSTSPVSLVMGPPVTPKRGRNRVRLDVFDPDRESGEYLDADGNEYDVRSG
jgi:hypothetical protein